MRAFSTALVITVVTAAAVAQQKGAPQAPVTYKSAADVAAMIAKAKAQNATKAQALISQTILSLSPYKANLEYRASVGPASIHLKEAEVFYVVDGSGTLITGGKLVGETKNGDNLTGTAIEGGTPQAVSKGDFIIVPENTGHWFSEIKSTLVLMSMHVPRPVPADK
ncbi:MAG TPA: cupin domain-containing protein [Bryobacteraceae bacterium]|jgi:quercetin dioxygenase-like cupin family protein